MNIHLSGTRYAVAVPLLLFAFTYISAQESPDDLLDYYFETESHEFAEQIMEHYPDSPHAVFLNAWEYIGANDEIARDLAGTMVEDFPDFAPGYLALGTVLSQGFKQYENSLKEFDRGIKLEPEFMLLYQNRGITRLGMNQLELARDDFEKVIKLKRGYARGYLLRGVADQRLGDEESMKADFEIGLQMDFRALSMIPRGIADEAMNRAIDAAPDNATYYYARGYAEFTRGNYRSASGDFGKCTRLVPGSSDFYKYSGACKMYLDDYENAQNELNLALSVNPDDPEIYYFLSVLSIDFQDQPARAMEYLNHAINLDENTARYYYARSKASCQMLDYREARNDINKAMRLDHRQGDYYALRGNIKVKLGSPKEDYCPDFSKALEWGTSYNLKRIMKKTCK